MKLNKTYMQEAGDDGAAAGGAAAPTEGAVEGAAAPAAEGAASGSLIGDQNSPDGDSGQGNGESEGSIITNTEGDNTDGNSDSEHSEAESEPRAPESYDDFQAPEGFNLQAEAIGSFNEWARGNDFTQEQAQAAIDYHADAMAQFQSLQTEQWAEARANWVKEAKADGEYGGKEFNQNMKHVGAALAKFGDKPLVDALNTMGVGDHPALVRFFWKVGKMVDEADLTGGRTEGGDTDSLSRFYPSMA